MNKILIIASSVIGVSLAIYFSLTSPFAKAHENYVPIDYSDVRNAHKSQKTKSKNANEKFYTKNLKQDKYNESVLSLGDFTINIEDNKKLIMKVSVKSDSKSIEAMLNHQAVVRNIVIKSVTNSRRFDQHTLSKKIISDINRALPHESIEEIYFEKFLVQ